MPNSEVIKAKPLILFVLLVALLLPMMLSAQPADATLSGLIGSIKAQKEAALDPRRAERPPPETKPKLAPPKTPIVWSIFGLNQAFSAVVVIDGKTHVLRSTDLPYRTAGWKVLSMDAAGLLVQGHGRRLWLPAPDVGTRPELYLQELGVTVSSNSSFDAADAGVLSHRLPLQSRPFSGSPSPPLKASVLFEEPALMPTKPATGFSSAQVRASSLSGETARRPVSPRADITNLEKR